MRPVCTNIYLVGNRALTMIDTGLQEDRYTQAMFAHLTKLGRRYRVEQAAITHSHPDHRGGLPWLRASIGPRLYAPAKAIAIAEPAVGKGLLAPLQEGDVLEADGVRLEVIDTPGHSEDSVSFWDREDGVLFTGDTILGKGTTVVHDLPAYMGSLGKLLALQPADHLPGPRPYHPGRGGRGTGVHCASAAARGADCGAVAERLQDGAGATAGDLPGRGQAVAPAGAPEHRPTPHQAPTGGASTGGGIRGPRALFSGRLGAELIVA